jgi:hypothetical protein
VRAPFRHGQAFVREQFRDVFQLRAFHPKPACKAMPQIVPDKIPDSSRSDSLLKPMPRVGQRLTRPARREHRTRLAPAMINRFERGQGRLIQWNAQRFPVLAGGDMQHPAIPVYHLPCQRVHAAFRTSGLRWRWLTRIRASVVERGRCPLLFDGNVRKVLLHFLPAERVRLAATEPFLEPFHARFMVPVATLVPPRVRKRIITDFTEGHDTLPQSLRQFLSLKGLIPSLREKFVCVAPGAHFLAPIPSLSIHKANPPNARTGHFLEYPSVRLPCPCTARFEVADTGMPSALS